MYIRTATRIRNIDGYNSSLLKLVLVYRIITYPLSRTSFELTLDLVERLSAFNAPIVLRAQIGR